MCVGGWDGEGGGGQKNERKEEGGKSVVACYLETS